MGRDPQSIIETADQERELRSELGEKALKWFLDQDGLVPFSEAVKNIQEQLDLSYERAATAVTSLTDDSVDPVQSVNARGQQWVGVIDFQVFQKEGGYGYQEYNDVHGARRTVVCGKCVEEQRAPADCFRAVSGVGRHGPNVNYASLLNHLTEHYTNAHEEGPETVTIGASLVSGTTIAGNTSLHNGNIVAGTNVDIFRGSNTTQFSAQDATKVEYGGSHHILRGSEFSDDTINFDNLTDLPYEVILKINRLEVLSGGDPSITINNISSSQAYGAYFDNGTADTSNRIRLANTTVRTDDFITGYIKIRPYYNITLSADLSIYSSGGETGDNLLTSAQVNFLTGPARTIQFGPTGPDIEAHVEYFAKYGETSPYESWEGYTEVDEPFRWRVNTNVTGSGTTLGVSGNRSFSGPKSYRFSDPSGTLNNISNFSRTEILRGSYKESNPDELVCTYWETSSSAGHAMGWISSDGDPLIIVGTTNPAPAYVDGAGDIVFATSSVDPDYREWRRFEIYNIDYVNETYDLTWTDLTGNSSDVTLTNLPFINSGSGITKTFIGTYREPSSQSDMGSDNIEAYVDSISNIPTSK